MANLKLKCPSCDLENSINIDKNIVCYNCKEKLFKSKNSFIKFAKETIIISGISGIIFFTYKIGHQNENRYTIKEEYAFLNECINSGSNLNTKKKINFNFEICVCTLSKIEKKKYTFEKLNNNTNIFSKYFDECKLNMITKNPKTFIENFSYD